MTKWLAFWFISHYRLLCRVAPRNDKKPTLSLRFISRHCEKTAGFRGNP
ncbi:hypothetical protein [Helicobacter rodentium]|nr:hypothetical protein [Helicobacter rodentium]